MRKNLQDKGIRRKLSNKVYKANELISNIKHSIQPEALRSWIHEKMNRAKNGESEHYDIFQASEFVELDIPGASKHRISVGIDRKELITVRAGGIKIDIPITTEETALFKIFQTAASI